jgi:ATP-dependent RNA helicase RhlE
MLSDPSTINLERRSAPAIGITQAVYPVARELKPALLLELLTRDIIADAIVFTRTKHRANRLAAFLETHRISTARIHGNRSQNQRTEALAGFKAGRHRILVATDIVSRGIDVEALGHVVNFDVPADPDSYIHRVGRTARAEATGDAFTLVSPEEEGDLAAIERVVGKRLPRVTLPGFDYAKRPEGRLEIPIRERLAAARAARGGGRPRPKEGFGAGKQKPALPSRGRGEREARLQAILDKHAPAAGAQPGARPRGPGPGRRSGR